MKSFRLSLGKDQEATGAGCLLALGSAAGMVALGVPLAFAIGDLTGFVFVAIPVGIGLLFFTAGSALMAYLKVPLWKDTGDHREIRDPLTPPLL